MKAVVVLGQGELEIRDYPDPVPDMDGIVIAVKASGMCGTDLAHLNGPRRGEDKIFIEGHEPCGVVHAVGGGVPPSQLAVGDRVMIHHYDGCRQCAYCRSGWTQFCPTHKVIFGGPTGHGSHAAYMKVPAHTAVPMPDALSYKAGAAIACGVGTAFGAVRRAGVRGDQTVAIFGQGPVGQAATMFAAAFGARVIALDVGPERLQRARAFGATHTVNAVEEDPVAAIRALSSDGDGADVTLECSGNRTARRQSIEAARRWGAACMVGAYGDIDFEIHHIIQLHKTVLGSLTFSKNMMAECARYVIERGIDLDQLYTHEFTIDEARAAYALFEERKIGKGVFVFD